MVKTDIESGYIAVNGINYYYETHGSGEAMLLLHGGLGSIEMFEPDLTTLSENRMVIAVDLQGHGRTELGDRPINLVDMGDDMAAILTKIGQDQVDVMGYSMGGGVALRLAIQHPKMVHRLVLVSTPFAQNGFYPEILRQQAQVGASQVDMMKETPMYKGYVARAPHPEDFPKLLDQMGEYMRQPYNWSDDIKKLQMPVLLIYGDSDMIRLDHAVEFYHLLGGGLRDAGWNREYMPQNHLAILPNLTHYEMTISPKLVEAVLPFLSEVSKTDR